MVGGTISDVMRLWPHKWWVEVIDRDTGDKAGLYLDPKGMLVSMGDSLWWQERWCFWSPPGAAWDIKLPKLSTSGVERPQWPH